MMKTSNKTILITGINGFLGSHLAKKLCVNFNVIGLEYKKTNLFRIEGGNFKIYYSSDDVLERIFEENNIFAIIHAATIYRRSNEPIESLFNTNIILPIKLYQIANDNQTELFFNTDSFFNSKKSNYRYLADYSLSKKHALEWLTNFKGNCKIINMKIFHMYGPNDANAKFIPQIINSLLNNVPHIDLTPGEQKRDFIFVYDVVDAFDVVLKKYIEEDTVYDEYEIGTGISISVKEILKLIKTFTYSKTELRFGALPYRKNEIMVSSANISNIYMHGWKHKYTLKEGIQRTIEALKENFVQ